MRHELSNSEWAAIKPMLPNKPRGVRRVNVRRGGARREPDPDVRSQRRHAAAE
jgi:transposase